MLRRISNILSGTYAHWNATNGRAFNRLWTDVCDRSAADIRPALKEICVAAYGLIEELIGPDSTRGILTGPLQLKKLSERDFANAYAVLLSGFASALSYTDPALGLRVMVQVELLTGSDNNYALTQAAAAGGDGGPKALALATKDLFASALAPVCRDPIPNPLHQLKLSYLFSVLFLTHCKATASRVGRSAAA